MYVTLEPCCHFGATPPCCAALAEAGVARVVAAIQDPNPEVNGRGLEALRHADIEVDTKVSGEDRQAAAELIEPFAFHLLKRRPLVTAKYAMSLDGKIATASGESQWITGAASRARAHEMRASSDAVMVGVGTALRDNPRLTARRPDRENAEPRPRWRIVVDSAGRLPPSSRLFWAPGSVLLAHAIRSEDAGPVIGFPDNVEKLALPPGYGGVDLVALMDDLGGRGVTSVMVEGGSTLLGSLFDLDLVDRVAAFVAPILIGGAEAPGPVGGHGFEALEEAPRLERVRAEPLGTDTLITGYLPGHEGHLTAVLDGLTGDRESGEHGIREHG